MGNSRVLQKATKELTKAKAPAKSRDIIYDPAGQWKFPGQETRIPGSDITMQGVPYPVYAQPNVGQPQMMYPGQDYVFPGADYVDEYPQMKKGGRPKGLIPMPKPSKKGLASKSYSRSLDATNKLFTENYLFKKPKDRKRKVFDPNAKYYADGGEYGMPLGAGVAQNFIGNRDEFKVGGIPELPLRDNQVNYDAYVNRFEPKTRMQDGGEQDAMNAMMKARLAYANEFGNPAAQRMINLPDNPYQFDDGNTGTHYMASMDNYAVPQIQDINGQLMLGDYGPESNEAIQFDRPEDAEYFAEHYKDVSPGFIEAELTDDEIEEYRKGGYIVEDVSIPSLNQYDKGGRFKRRKKKQEEQEQLEYRPPVEVNDEMYESVTPFPEAPEEFKQGVGNIKEVEKKAQAPDWLKFSNEYEKKNSKQAFIDEKKKEYLKGTNQGLLKAQGYNMENFPEDVERNFEKAYDYKKNSFIVKKLGKKEKFSPNRRGEWVDELSKKEKEIVANSKYENKLQPSYWSRTLAGLQELYGDVYAPGVSSRIPISGLTKKEQKDIQNSKLGAFETLAGWDALGAVAANALEQSGNSGYGASYRESPGILSGEKMAGVTDVHAMALNPLNYTLPYDMAAAAPSIIKGVGNVAKTTGKVLTETTPLKNAYKLNKRAIKESAVGPLVRTDKPHWVKGYKEPINSGVIDINDVIKKATPEDLTKLQLKDLEYKNKLRRNKTMSPEDINALNKDIEQFVSIEKFAKESKPEWNPTMSFDSPIQERRAFVEQMQKEGLVSNKLSKPAVSNIAINEKKFNELTKKALEKFNEGYRNVDTNAETLQKLKDPEIFNMFDKGVDIADPVNVGEYMATTVPQEAYYYRQGFANSGLGKEYDALYSHSLPSNEFGERMYKVKLGDTDFSTGDFKDWYQKNYKEKIRGYDPSIRGYHNENMFEPGVFAPIKGDQGAYRVFTGKRGEKVLTADPTYKYHGVNWKELSPEQQKEMYDFFKAEKRNYEKGWYEPNRPVKTEVQPKVTKEPEVIPDEEELIDLKELPGSSNKSFMGKVKDYFDRPPGPLMLGMPKGAVFTKEIKNPDYFLDLMKINKYSAKNKKYFEDLIATVKRQGNVASERQYDELQRLKTGDMNYGKKGYAKGGIVSELSKKEIKDLVAQGYIVEEVD